MPSVGNHFPSTQITVTGATQVPDQTPHQPRRFGMKHVLGGLVAGFLVGGAATGGAVGGLLRPRSASLGPDLKTSDLFVNASDIRRGDSLRDDSFVAALGATYATHPEIIKNLFSDTPETKYNKNGKEAPTGETKLQHSMCHLQYVEDGPPILDNSKLNLNQTALKQQIQESGIDGARWVRAAEVAHATHNSWLDKSGDHSERGIYQVIAQMTAKQHFKAITCREATELKARDCVGVNKSSEACTADIYARVMSALSANKPIAITMPIDQESTLLDIVPKLQIIQPFSSGESYWLSKKPAEDIIKMVSSLGISQDFTLNKSAIAAPHTSGMQPQLPPFRKLFTTKSLGGAVVTIAETPAQAPKNLTT